MGLMSYTAEQRDLLTQQAHAAIVSSFISRSDPPEFLDEANHWLQQHRACFITLKKSGVLRGCIGSLKATRPLLDDIWYNAQAAAFKDPRFPPVEEDEIPEISMEISVLSALQPLSVNSEAELLRTIRPGIDGLLIQEGLRKATFLPSVWEQLPEPDSFLERLKMKGGWAKSYWSSEMEFYIYQVEKWSDKF